MWAIRHSFQQREAKDVHSHIHYRRVDRHIFPNSCLHTVRMEVKDTGGLTSSTTRQVTIYIGTCGVVYLPLIIR